MSHIKEQRLARYVETGVLPGSQYLTPEQCEAVVHAPADVPTADLAADLGASPVGVKHYRWLLHGCLSCRIHIQCCVACGAVFVTDRSRQFMHPACREALDTRWEMAMAA